MHRISCSKSLHMFKMHLFKFQNQSTHIKAILPGSQRPLILGQTRLPFPFKTPGLCRSTIHPTPSPRTGPRRCCCRIESTRASSTGHPKLEPWKHRKTPKAPHLTLILTPTKGGNLKKRWKVLLRFGFLWNWYVKCSKNFNNAFQKKTRVSTKNRSLSVPLSKGSPQWLVQCWFRFYIYRDQ